MAPMANSCCSCCAFTALLCASLPAWSAGAPGGAFLEQVPQLEPRRATAINGTNGGSSIRVVTDMGFDDWGAFAVLQAFGQVPQAALATKGMMLPTLFKDNFTSLLQSWSFPTIVYPGTEDCYGGKQCPQTDFIQESWGYRTNVANTFPSALGPSKKKQLAAATDFWVCDSNDGPYTLLVLSPMSDIATKLVQSAASRKCIKEIVVSGTFFTSTPEGKNIKTYDEVTYRNTVDSLPDIGADKKHDAELNVVADVPAAQAILGLGLTVTVIPIEVESIDRVGKQMIQKNPSLKKTQTQLTDERVRALCKLAEKNGPPATMLGKLACIHKSGGNVATLDLDAIVAMYLSKPELFTVSKEYVKVKDNGVTVKCTWLPYLGCSSVNLATQFDADAWFNDMEKQLQQ